MEINQETIKERERIKEIIINKIEARIDWRGKNRAGHGFISHFKKLQDDILFLIDNPNYEKKDIDYSKQKNRRPKIRKPCNRPLYEMPIEYQNKYKKQSNPKLIHPIN